MTKPIAIVLRFTVSIAQWLVPAVFAAVVLAKTSPLSAASGHLARATHAPVHWQTLKSMNRKTHHEVEELAKLEKLGRFVAYFAPKSF